MEKKTPAINTIDCGVVNCVYHSGENKCTAPTVKVSPPSASRSDQTFCGTFQSKGSG